MMSSFMLGKQILPMLETAGLIIQEQDPGDKRKLLVFPTEMMGKKNSSNEGGVDEDDFQKVLIYKDKVLKMRYN